MQGRAAGERTEHFGHLFLAVVSVTCDLSILIGQQDRCHASVGLGDNPKLLAHGRAVGRDDPRSLLDRLIIQAFVTSADFVPIARDMPGNEVGRIFRRSFPGRRVRPALQTIGPSGTTRSRLRLRSFRSFWAAGLQRLRGEPVLAFVAVTPRRDRLGVVNRAVET